MHGHRNIKNQTSCILLVFFPHALLTMHGHRNIKNQTSCILSVIKCKKIVEHDFYFLYNYCLKHFSFPEEFSEI